MAQVELVTTEINKKFNTAEAFDEGVICVNKEDRPMLVIFSFQAQKAFAYLDSGRIAAKGIIGKKIEDHECVILRPDKE